MKINDEILRILQKSLVVGDIVYLPEGQLDRKTYEAVNKCLANLGGKWNRSKKGHVFDHDISDAFEVMLMTGETEDMKKTFQFFPTPPAAADLMCDMAELSHISILLEPSCGDGALLVAARERGVTALFGIEINTGMEIYLEAMPFDVKILWADFLTLEGGCFDDDPHRVRFDRILMNPPFTKQQDIAHIRHAYDFLEPGGILVAVCSPGPFFRKDRKSTEFGEWICGLDAEIVDVPEGAFKESGTSIRTKIIKIRKQA
ncbi:MAG: N-6 DNA methylase [Clostridiales Family XIII bacterium]|nr:N-6 DNA methylase [Clostridiales Family XIII bacterium]